MSSLFIVSGPSASGKDALIDALMDIDSKVLRGRKFTTRTPRPGERKTGSYLYLSHEQFHKRLKAGELFFDYVKNEIWYAVDKQFITDEISSGYDVFLVFSKYDKVGELKEAISKEGITTKSILIVSSLSDLECRIRGRYCHSPEELPRRLDTMREDLKLILSGKKADYDFILANPNHPEGIQPLVKSVKEIMHTQRLNLANNEESLNLIFGTYKSCSS